MSQILAIKFGKTSKIYYYTSNNIFCRVNQFIIAEYNNCIFLGKVVKIMDKLSPNFLRHNMDHLKPIIRLAHRQDITQYQLNRKSASLAYKYCLDKIGQYRLKMKLIDVECTLDRKKYIFLFTADGKIDFRNLVKDLAYQLKSRIELRQIGVRDKSKRIGGIGVCGQPFCCSRFLNDFGTVSIKMAKEQGVSLNPTKLFGNCGRLMCCLQYEQKAYDELIKNSPKIGQKVKTSDGIGKIIDINLINGLVKVESKNNKDLYQVYHKNDIEIIK